MPYDPALAAPASPYRLTPYEVVHPPMPGAYSHGIPGVSPVVTESGGNSRVQLTIVGAQVGAVLGRNGTNISQIRQVSPLVAFAPHAALQKFVGLLLTRHHLALPFCVVIHMSRMTLAYFLGDVTYSCPLHAHLKPACCCSSQHRSSKQILGRTAPQLLEDDLCCVS